MVIDIPSSVKIEQMKRVDLKGDWAEYMNYAYCQSLGDEWIRKGTSAVLEVPSAIIQEERNFLLNPQHPQFNKISISTVEDFSFDQRLTN